MPNNTIPGPYRVQFEREGDFSVYQPNGTIVARCALRKTADECANALNACAILPVLAPDHQQN